MVLVKNLKFFNLFIFGKIRDKNVFDDILEMKKAFLDYKKEKVKTVKIGIFPKGLVHGFGQKFENFPCFILGKIREESVLDDILERKKAF